MAELNLDKIYSSFLLAIEETDTLDKLTDIHKEFLGKNSVISAERKSLASLSNLDKKKYGQKIKEITENILNDIETHKLKLIKAKYKEREEKEFTDITIDWFESTGTKEHIISSVMEEVVQIFSSIGYTVAHGPEAETSWHNFDALNTPI